MDNNLKNSKTFLNKILDLPSFIIASQCRTRINQFHGSFYNELLCNSTSVINMKVQKQILPFKLIKQYIEICFAEHFIILSRSQESAAVGDESVESLKNYQNILDNLLNIFEIWIDKVEKNVRDRPISCKNCGLRFNSVKLDLHQCRVLNLMSHVCVCGEVFDDHMDFVEHIHPVNTNYTSTTRNNSLPFPKCKMISLHYLLTWLRMIITTQNFNSKPATKSRITNQESGEFFHCDICDKEYTNFITWIIDYSVCIHRDVLTCQVCADYIGGLHYDLFPKLKSLIIPLKPFDINSINLKMISHYFLNSKLTRSTNINEIMTLIGFENIFHFELNKTLKGVGDIEEFRKNELMFYKYRNQQLLIFLTDFPNVCEKCFGRFNNFNSIVVRNTRKKVEVINNKSLLVKHRCRGLKPEEHVCVCTARFSNHESYVYHRLYRCQYLLYVHVCLLMISNRITNINSMCNLITKPIHDLSELRNHWKMCKECHMIWIQKCSFCSEKYKRKFNGEICENYFRRLLKAKDFVSATETQVETSMEKQFNSLPGSCLKSHSHTLYDTKLYCLKSGPPFHLIEVEGRNTIENNFYNDIQSKKAKYSDISDESEENEIS